jgi:hypothetical protein
MNAATTSQQENDYYSLDFKYTGLAVMINNFEFTSNRFPNFPKNVSDKDTESFGTLKDFNFQIEEVMLNQTKAQITEIIAKYTSFDYADYACILFCMSSHGEQNTIISSDCVGIDIQTEIIEPFYKVASLENKPKIFLFDCCRGNKSVKKAPGNSDADIGKENNDEENNPFELPNLPKNFFILYATIPNYIAGAARKIGSYFIATFFEVLRKHGKTDDWDSLLRKVVKLMEERHIQVPINEKKNAMYKLAFVKKLENQLKQQQVFIMYKK